MHASQQGTRSTKQMCDMSRATTDKTALRARMGGTRVALAAEECALRAASIRGPRVSLRTVGGRRFVDRQCKSCSLPQQRTTQGSIHGGSVVLRTSLHRGSNHDCEFDDSFSWLEVCIPDTAAPVRGVSGQGVTLVLFSSVTVPCCPFFRVETQNAQRCTAAANKLVTQCGWSAR